MIVNQGETPLDDGADVTILAPIGEVLPAIVRAGGAVAR